MGSELVHFFIGLMKGNTTPVSRAAEWPARLRVLTTTYAALVIEGGLHPLTIWVMPRW